MDFKSRQMEQMIKVSPSAVDLEKSVLGGILLEKEAIYKVLDILLPEMFYHDAHRIVFGLMIECLNKSLPIDLNYFSQYVKDQGQTEAIGGDYYLTSLTNTVVSSAHIVSHSRIIVQMYIKRELIKVAGETMDLAYDGSIDAFEILAEAEKRISALNQIGNTSESVRIDSVLVEVMQEMESLRHREQWLTGVPSKYKTVDHKTMGWQETDLIIIAARPAVGKTAFTLSLAVNASLSNVPAAFFSLEMGRKQLVKRILASQAKMFLSTIRAAKLTDGQMEHLFTNGIQPLAGIPLFIDDTASMTVQQLKGKLRRLKRLYGVRIAFVDYLQLLKSGARKGANMHEQVGDISRELKIAAKELDMPIIALSQLNRDADGKVPQLSNLKESGSIEQDADMVCFLYGHSEGEIKMDLEKANEIFFKLAKHRNGDLGTIRFQFDKSYQSFEDQGEGELQTPLPTGNWKKITADDPF